MLLRSRLVQDFRLVADWAVVAPGSGGARVVLRATTTRVTLHIRPGKAINFPAQFIVRRQHGRHALRHEANALGNVGRPLIGRPQRPLTIVHRALQAVQVVVDVGDLILHVQDLFVRLVLFALQVRLHVQQTEDFLTERLADMNQALAERGDGRLEGGLTDGQHILGRLGEDLYQQGVAPPAEAGSHAELDEHVRDGAARAAAEIAAALRTAGVNDNRLQAVAITTSSVAVRERCDGLVEDSVGLFGVGDAKGAERYYGERRRRRSSGEAAGGLAGHGHESLLVRWINVL